MAKAKPRVKVPKSAKAGDVITIKTLISHKMESGQRKDKAGKVIPRKIINKFTCEFNGPRCSSVISIRQSQPIRILSSLQKCRKAASSSSPGWTMTAPFTKQAKKSRSSDVYPRQPVQRLPVRYMNA